MEDDTELQEAASVQHEPERLASPEVDNSSPLLRLHAARDLDSLAHAFAALFDSRSDGVIACAFLDDGAGLLSPLPDACRDVLETLRLTPETSDHLKRVYVGGEVVVTDNIEDTLGCPLPELQGYRAFLCRLAWEDEVLGVLLVCDHGETDLQTCLLAAQHLSLALVTLRALDKTYHFGGIDPVHWMFDREWLQQRLAEEVDRALRYRRPLSLLLYRFDNLDVLRDEQGNAQVQVFLRRVAAAVRSQIRSPDVIAAYSDDTIAVLLPETDRSSAATIQNRMLARILQLRPQMANDLAWKPELSRGLGCIPEDGNSVTDVISSALVMTPAGEDLAESA